MSAAKTVTVSFKALPAGPFHLMVTAPAAHGTLTATPTEPAGGYTSGTIVTLTAVPEAGYAVDTWSASTEHPAATVNSNTVLMDADKTVTVSFKTQTFVLTLTHTGPGTVTASPAGPYAANTIVTITAAPLTDYSVSTWPSNVAPAGADAHATTATITMTADASVAVVLGCVGACQTLTLHVDDGAFPDDYVDFGFITAADSLDTTTQIAATAFGHNHGQVTAAVPTGHSVKVTAHELEASWNFQQWTGTDDGGKTWAVAADCTDTVTMSGPKTLAATFPDGSNTSHCPNN